MIRPLTAFLITTVIAVFGMFAFAQNSTQYVPTYYVDVQPILEKNCVSCHVTGGIAPFTLDNPTTAVQWADRIAEVTREEYMPPFPPSRESQRFLNERRLGSASKKILEDWAKAKAPLGKAPRK